MTRPTFSILITCYNYEAYVAQAIESALAQTLPVEVVVVDDGSTDRSAEAVARYGDRVRLVRQPNQGSIAAYNRAFAESTGDFVHFLDADDLVAPDMAQRVVDAWRPGQVKVQFDLHIIDHAGRDLGRRFCHFPAGYGCREVRAAFDRTGTYRWPVTVGNVYRRDFLQRLMPLAVEHGPDGFLNTLAPLYGEVGVVAECLASYRLHGSNMWGSNGTDIERLSERIAHRQGELAALQAHARRLGRVVPADALDHELAFINYRLMALKLGQPYPGHQADSPAALCRLAHDFLRREPMPATVRAAHASWFELLRRAPRPVARALVRFRYRRAELLRPWADLKRRLGRPAGAGIARAAGTPR